MKDLLVIDDDPTVIATLRRALQGAGFRVRFATTGLMGLELFAEQRADLVILDLGLPELDGFGVLGQLRRESHVPVVVLSADTDIPTRVRVLTEGADDYLAKPFEFEELLARLQAVWRRSNTVPAADPTRFETLALDPTTHEATVDGRPLVLTPREYELLAYLIRHPRQVLTREQIIEGVWGYEHGGTSNVVDVYIRSLRSKLRQHNTPDWLHTVRGVGYSLRS